MSLFGILVAVLILSVILYLISILPIEPRVKQIVTIVIVLIAIIYLLQILFNFIPLGSTRIGSLSSDAPYTNGLLTAIPYTLS
jgi:hypothetical protein